ncbi:hypothetical protein LCGC14_1725450 [marine sediment metagenome]|uniref:Uncharacterized protein n=1 Tax=marine sediment metagenome TaxID=412755 RepID=A0A0F9HZ10_9ZZZZ
MPNTIEWYDQVIMTLKKLINQHERELKLIINQLEDHLKTQKEKFQIETATGEATSIYYLYKESIDDEYGDIDTQRYDLKRNYHVYAKYLDITLALNLLQSLSVDFYIGINYYETNRKLGSVRESLIQDINRTIRLTPKKKGKEIKKEKTRLTRLIEQRESLKVKLESQGVEVPILNLEKIESKIEQEISTKSLEDLKLGIQDETAKFRLAIQYTKNSLTKFLELIEEPDSIIKYIEAVGLSVMKKVIDLLFEITWKLGESGYVFPSCQKIYIKKEVMICEVCGHDFNRISLE